MDLQSATPSALAVPRIAAFRRFFLNRTDLVAVAASWGSPCPAKSADLDALLLRHLDGARAEGVAIEYQLRDKVRSETGRYRVGAYTPAPDNQTKWLCLDFDAGKGTKSHPLADATAAVRCVAATCCQLGLLPYLERSGGGQGWHLWLFFDPPLPAVKARQLGLQLLPHDVPLVEGGCADPERNLGMEVFPKKTHLDKGPGSMVWLPWWHGAAQGGSQFYNLLDEDPPAGSEAVGESLVEIPDFQTMTEAQVDAILSTASADNAAANNNRSASPPTPSPSDDTTLPPDVDADGNAEVNNETWQVWRCAALAQLDLEAIYGPWLTGKTRPGWLECRDPLYSTTGDTNPSAAVADGTSNEERPAQRGSFFSFISGECLSVFDFLIRIGQAPDFLAAARIVAAASGVPLPNVDAEHDDPASDSAVATKMVIAVNNRQPIDVINDAWTALTGENHRPTLYRRSTNVVRIKRSEQGELHIATLGPDDMAGMLYRVARWVKKTSKAGPRGTAKSTKKVQMLDTPPPPYVARDMLNFPAETLPVLEGVVRAPTFGSAGELIAETGYYPQDRLVLAANQDLQAVLPPDAPTADDVAQARGLLLDELFGDFEFQCSADRAHALAALLLPFVRRLIPGPTPLHLIESPSPGSGKGLLCSCITLVANGEDCPARVLSQFDDEIRKMITAELSRAKPVILLDNVNTENGRKLDSPALASALTSTTWTDRVLNETRMTDLPNRAVWLLTANNPKLSLELARRCVRIRIVPRQDRPWLRREFRHPRLKGWILANRGKLIGAVLVLVKAWLVAGRPAGEQQLGSYEPWSEIVGGILTFVGVPGFLQNLNEVYAEADAEADPWREFTQVWWGRYGDTAVQVRDLCGLCNAEDLLIELRGEGTPRSQETKLGYALASRQERVFGARRLVRERRARGSWFALRPATADGAGAAATEDAGEQAATAAPPPAGGAGQGVRCGYFIPWSKV